MKLVHFFRLASMIVGQSRQINSCLNNPEEIYQSIYFFMPRVYAKDGFNISLQINNGNYCSSENGYRSLGHTWERVEFGFPSEDDKLLHIHAEGYGYAYDADYNEIDFNESNFTSVDKVGSIPLEALDELFEKRGGIDWDKTISVEQFNKHVKQ